MYRPVEPAAWPATSAFEPTFSSAGAWSRGVANSSWTVPYVHVGSKADVAGRAAGSTQTHSCRYSHEQSNLQRVRPHPSAELAVNAPATHIGCRNLNAMGLRIVPEQNKICAIARGQPVLPAGNRAHPRRIQRGHRD